MAGDDITAEWPVQDIVFTSIVGLVMIAAVLEWFLWIAAFLYCLWKVFVKAEHWTIRVLSIIVAIVFTALRFIFLPIMIVTLPLPTAISRHWPEDMRSSLQWFAFWSFAGLLTIPWLFCIYQLVTHQLGRTKRIRRVLDEVSAPKVVVVMPCYREEPDVLVTAINSVVDCDYPPSCIHVFLSFDGDQVDELYLNTIEKLGVPVSKLTSYPKSIDVAYRGARITVSRFVHGGKRHCQKATFRLIDKVYQAYLKRNDNLFILFIDSDCILDTHCLQNFVYDMELSPGNRRDMLAMTGVITSTTKRHSLITLLQDMEYIHGQLFERTVESGCGAVTCLPGALTMLRFSAFRRMAKYYFADKAEQCEDLFDFAKCHLGEDRWLTHLFMIGAKKRYQIQMCTSAFCKTEAVQTTRSLIKQRRRWFLGFITNEACMLTDWRLWKRYPILVLVRFMQNTIRTTALLFFIMLLALITTSAKVDQLPVGFIAISLGLNWLLMLYFGAKLKRFKIWLYPLMFLFNPFFNWFYMVYGIFTAGQRTWGGPRADAAAADVDTTPQQAIEAAELAGDDLNVVPESFIPATVARRESIKRATTRGKGTAGGMGRRGGGGENGNNKMGAAAGAAAGGYPYYSSSSSYYDDDRTGTGTDGSLDDGAGIMLGRRGSLVRPPDQINGLFVARSRKRGGQWAHADDSLEGVCVDRISEDLQEREQTRGGVDERAVAATATATAMAMATVPPWTADPDQQQQRQQQPGHGRDSIESSAASSFASARDSRDGGRSSPVYMPGQVESIMSDEDRKKYEMAQRRHASTSRGDGQGTGQGRGHPMGRVYEFADSAELRRAGFSDSPEPFDFGSEVRYTDNVRMASSISVESVSGGRQPSSPELGLGASDQSSGAQQGLGARATMAVGRSPLGRDSLVRTPSGEEDVDGDGDGDGDEGSQRTEGRGHGYR